MPCWPSRVFNCFVGRHPRKQVEHELLISQLYFPGDERNDDDGASAVKSEFCCFLCSVRRPR
ncbi:catechol 1,2-dioxygenase [Amycolatopsis decaplanina DSM 44594]|uniref:Catechol 1,2-dioxygenase n=1 Tax=Amycolatopsis decaplanina DSM 44594 TaxID=1284240 RepID=M2WR76_9PSEU|nr:catechol 1,2-dioxygenase [Amycolatopsis decaplanina DSM 44594]